MNNPARHWQRVSGDGMIYDGPCIVKIIIMWPDANNDYADIYDGRDTVTGKKFCRVENATDGTVWVNLGDGVLFGRGIYVDGKDSAVETTVGFDPIVPGE